MENKVRMKRDHTLSTSIDEKITPWILDTSYCLFKEQRDQVLWDNGYLMTHKRTITFAMEHNGNHNNEILNMLDKLDNKYKIIINVIWEFEDGTKKHLGH